VKEQDKTSLGRRDFLRAMAGAGQVVTAAATDHRSRRHRIGRGKEEGAIRRIRPTSKLLQVKSLSS
jgi:hypothetical protein